MTLVMSPLFRRAIRPLRPLLLGLAIASLAACSTTRVVEGQVKSFSTLTTVPAPATFQLERLPSQQGQEFDTILALAEQSLQRAGLQRDDAAPRLRVQISVESGSVPRYDPYGPYGFNGGWSVGGWYGGGFGMRSIWRMGDPTPLHHRAVGVVMRDAQTQKVVYETSAVHDDVWVQDPEVYGLLFDAALTGFPQPPSGPREVRMTLQPTPKP
jgi:hypothetical protein